MCTKTTLSFHFTWNLLQAFPLFQNNVMALNISERHYSFPNRKAPCDMMRKNGNTWKPMFQVLCEGFLIETHFGQRLAWKLLTENSIPISQGPMNWVLPWQPLHGPRLLPVGRLVIHTSTASWKLCMRKVHTGPIQHATYTLLILIQC